MELDYIDISRGEDRRAGTSRRPQGGSGGERISKGTQRRSGNTPGRGRDKRERERQERERQERERQERERRRRRRRRKKMAVRMITLLFLALLIILLIILLFKLITSLNDSGVESTFNLETQRRTVIKANEAEKPDILEDFLTVNEYSRPGEELKKVNNIFVHYTANPGTSAAQNRSYFENLGITGETSASAHFVIGYEGEIIQCIPLNEIGYAVMQRNYDSISIECCYLDEDGKFTDATYQSLIELSAWLLKEYKLAPEDMRRHYDEGGKKCPLYYVEHEDAWEQFLKDLEAYIMKDQV